MHIISQKRIWDAKEHYHNCINVLDAWYRIIKKNSFENFASLKKAFNNVDKVQNLYIFDIGGNKLRIIATIHFQRQKVYTRDILSHTEYDKKTWKQ